MTIPHRNNETVYDKKKKHGSCVFGKVLKQDAELQSSAFLHFQDLFHLLINKLIRKEERKKERNKERMID